MALTTRTASSDLILATRSITNSFDRSTRYGINAASDDPRGSSTLLPLASRMSPSASQKVALFLGVSKRSAASSRRPTIAGAAGTCRLGKKGDPEAVVDPKLRLIGIDCLRIVGAFRFADLVVTDQVRAGDPKNVEGTWPYRRGTNKS